MLELGGNIYFTAKLGATDGHPFQHLAALMTGSTQQDYADLMLRGGRSVDRQPQPVGQVCQGRVEHRQGQASRKPPARERNAVARIIAGVTSSHVPAIGAAIDNHRTGEPYWQRVFEGFERSKEWMRNAKPDVVIGVYNDHASAFSVEIIPTFALGTAAEFPHRRRRLGPASGAGGEGPSASLPRISRSRSSSTSSTSRCATRWRSTTASPCRST